MKNKHLLFRIYSLLLSLYGPQGWWPVFKVIGKQGNKNEYHPLDYEIPKSRKQRFEICLGAILTQNTSWVQVVKALENLHELNLLSPERILQLEPERLQKIIQPTGYFRQKEKKIRIFSSFFQKLGKKIPRRNELLLIWGIGPETADSMLLYAFKKPYFVIDSYTRRFFSSLGLIKGKESYELVQAFFEANLPEDVIVFQEYHALIVQHAKRYYSKNLPANGDPIVKIIASI
ncbi:endonuclease III domain-containing protein [Candidatus Riflebacteria bacterium]